MTRGAGDCEIIGQEVAMLEAGGSIETPIDAGSVEGEYRWLAENPCDCGDPWRLVRQAIVRQEEGAAGTRITDRLDLHCDGCGRERQAFLVVTYGEGGEGQ